MYIKLIIQDFHINNQKLYNNVHHYDPSSLI